MKLNHPIQGKHVNLRTANPNDAEFILSLRLDKELSKYLKPTDPSVEKQRQWIKSKQKKEDDYHMIIENKNGKSIGVIALYDIKNDTFNGGRWLLSRNCTLYAAIESCYLLYSFAFNILNLKKGLFEIRKNNKKVIAFHKTLGADIVREDDTYIYISYHKEKFNYLTGYFNKHKKTLGLEFKY